MEALKFVYLLILSSFLTFVTSGAQFDNRVISATPSLDGVYRFYWNISIRLTMANFTSENQNHFPLIFDEGNMKFHVRDEDFSKPCDKKKPEHVHVSSIYDTAIFGDGRSRAVIVINGQLPGPAIVVPQDAKVEVIVQNYHLYDEVVTIHWHGQTQKHNFYMDGVARITQCPIYPGATFTYRFKATEAGTHWWHSHSNSQRADGLYGPLVVLKSTTGQNTATEESFDRDYHFFVQDWSDKRTMDDFLHEEWKLRKFFYGYENENKCFAPTSMPDGTHASQPFESVLINGKGWHHIEKWDSDYQKKHGHKLPIERFTISQGERVRFRVVGANAAHMLMISVDGHMLTVIASDGNPIEPIEAHYLVVSGGERYDFYITGLTGHTGNNYWIRVRTLETHYQNGTDIPDNQSNYGLAILHYDTMQEDYEVGRISEPHDCSSDNLCLVVNCPGWLGIQYRCKRVADFKNAILQDSEMTEELVKNIYNDDEFEEHFLNYHFTGKQGSQLRDVRSAINQYRFVAPVAPPYQMGGEQLENAVTHCANCSDPYYCECTHIIRLGLGKVIQLVVFNLGPGALSTHPIHIHGHQFYVMKVGYPTYRRATDHTVKKHYYKYDHQNMDIHLDIHHKCTGTKNCPPAGWADRSWHKGALPNLNTRNPPLKDTVLLPRGAYAVLRFKADNPGWWAMHCHLEMHQLDGMMVIFQEGSASEIETYAPPCSDLPICKPQKSISAREYFANMSEE